ncbi:nitrate reductase cytochrome c-type subunit [Maritimibacter sp. UBA3975]|uniref:nitrate reductase cytochrome c-type subunit n=1 Tax=Maritimibacter sp. UBA3975 TaxID=1946833 RepID=UPI000C0994D3|nr:nitrate reductase cytochrome c-type subunit [Maritimibacter sp. UBA3975]MAM63368.1 periplasmic nitrate reductase electron transfer subunit [Maritimibacter sp.]|tara:strand:- start:110088 stop:110549 length:462 start_codon:yes stop_codon:yes gene_type:complete
MSRTTLQITALACVLATGVAVAQQSTISTLRPTPPTEDETPPPMRPAIDTDIREVRNYPEQPPVIPHDIEGYELSANFNKCLSCHERAATGQSQAPMVSVTHYIDRHQQVLAQVSPRRYFCTQCHVSQTEDAPLVANTFIDIDTLIGMSQESE